MADEDFWGGSTFGLQNFDSPWNPGMPVMYPQDTQQPPAPQGGKNGFSPDYILLHDLGGEGKQYLGDDAKRPPYHAVVYPDGNVVYRNPDDPYGAQAPHAYRFNPHSLGIAYAGQVGDTPTPEAMDSIRAEVDKASKQYGIQPNHILSHGEAYALTEGTGQQASKDGRDLDEASWRKYIRDPSLALPSGPGGGIGSARLAQSGPVQTDAQPPAVRPTPPYQPNWFERMTTQNAPFMAGLSMMPGGANAANAAAQTTNSMIAAGRYANESQQRAQRQDIWNNQLFPGGQPNRNHPLLRNAPDDIVQAAAISGPDEGLPWLQKYAFASAEQQLQMRLYAQRANQVRELFRQRQLQQQQQEQPQQPPAPPPQSAPAPAPQNPPMVPATATPGVVLPPARPSPPAAAAPNVPAPQTTGDRPQASPGFIPPGWPDRVPGIASRNYDIGASVFNDPNVEDALQFDLAFGDKTGRGVSQILNQALTKAQAPEQAYKTAFATARGKSEGERVSANQQMQIPLATIEHIEDKIRHTPQHILNAATGPYMGDNQAQAIKQLFMPTKDAIRVYNLNTDLHHIVETVLKEVKTNGSTDQDQAIAGRAMGMFLKIKNDPDKVLEVINDAKNMIRAGGGAMPQYIVQKYMPEAANVPQKPAPSGYRIIRRIDQPTTP